jgi:pimeloyl-ACP methyl ester carboxylesterase
VASLYPLDRWLATPLAGELAGAALLTVAGVTLAAAPLRKRLARGLSLDDRYLDEVGRRLTRPSSWRSFAVEQRALVAELPALEERLEQIAAHTTIIAGSEDRIVPLSSLRTLSEQIPDAELVLLPRAGHLLPLREAGALAAIVRAAAQVA